jgi:hypothetical protein
LWPAIAGAPFALAPERAKELQRLIDERNIKFQLDEITHEMKFDGADLFGGLGLVCVGLRGLERLWVHAYAAMHVYLRFQSGGFSQPIKLTDTSEGRVVEEILNWALQGELHGNPTPWPDNLPHPKSQPTDQQNQLANELFLGATGFAVLHEIGHLARGHRGVPLNRDVSYREEFEADEWAYDWVMDRWRDYRPDEAVFTKRATLVASLFALIAINQVYYPRRVVESRHPNTIDRLLQFLIKHANEDSGLSVGLVWSVPALTIHLHLSQILSTPMPVFSDSRTYFTVIRNVIDQSEPR